MIYRKYKVDKKNYTNLSNEDLSLLKILESVVKDLSDVYSVQLKTNFYSKTVSKTEVEKAAKSDPELLSPFTYVLKKGNRLEAVPYHIQYAKYLSPIAKKINKAAAICTNKSFKAYLEVSAKALLDESYTEAFQKWSEVKNSKIDFSIRPNERYLDKLFLRKRTFQAHVGIINEEYTNLAERYKETLYSSAKLGFSKVHSIGVPRKGVSVLVEATPAISGYPAEILASGQDFQPDLNLALQSGSRIVLYGSQILFKFEKIYYPIFKSIFENRFASKYSEKLLLDASGWCIFLYEVGQQLHKFEGARERLKEFYAPIEKANGFASGIAHSKHLVVKGLLSQEELEAIMIIHIVWMLSDWVLFRGNIAKENHIIGNAILLTSYLSHGALKESQGISWPNFSKIFFEIEELAYKLTYFLQKGSYQEAKEFIKKNADFKSFERLAKSLSHIKFGI